MTTEPSPSDRKRTPVWPDNRNQNTKSKKPEIRDRIKGAKALLLYPKVPYHYPDSIQTNLSVQGLSATSRRGVGNLEH
jgi:hypothetical protein